jgi:hypothetical protein
MATVRSDQSAEGGQPATEPRLGLLLDVVDELRWTFSARKGWLIGIAGNLVIAAAYIGFTRYDPHRSGDLRITNIAVAVVVWTLADVVNTNQLGSDADRVVASLEAGDSVPRILAIKNLALAVLLVPLALMISVLVRVLVGRWHYLLHPVITDVGAVFLWFGVGNVFSVLLPFHPMSLRARLKARPTWRRWAICQAAPYFAVIVVMPVVHLPYVALYHYHVFGRYLPNIVKYSLAYLAIALVCWLLGLWLSWLYARFSRTRLVADLGRGG